METHLPTSVDPSVAPRPRLLALTVGTVITMATLLALSRWLSPALPAAVVLIPLAGGLVAGACTALVARTYFSGNPALAYGVALLAYTAVVPGLPGDPFALLGCMLGLVACITACWAVDVGINFPRAYPDPAQRPSGKHVDAKVLATRILPGTGGLAGIAYLGASAPEPSQPLAYFLILALGSAMVYRFIELPGSLWAGFEPLTGLLL